MSFTKSIQLSIIDLDEAKVFAALINESITTQHKESFNKKNLDIGATQASNGAYEYTFQNSGFSGKAKLVVGWDMKHVDGANKRFMALNFNHKFGSRLFQDSIESIEGLPDKGYFGGMLIGGFLSFAGCMGYAYYTEALDVFFFFFVILVGGWLS
ncbi:MAG: hypothetical protein MK132_18600 [Lentisphaerales bacterium]|nr:hypothetical protein [Lentisphaerales bacterium]